MPTLGAMDEGYFFKLGKEQETILRQAAANVQAVQKKIVDKFRTDAESRADSIRDGKFTEELTQQLDQAFDEFQAEYAGLKKKASNVASTAKIIERELKNMQGASADLRKAVGDLKTLSDDLGKEIRDLHDKVKGLGKNTGAFAASAVLSAIKLG